MLAPEFLTLIGKRWATIKDETRKRRLDDPDDFVRQEIRAAIQRDDVLVIPVLIEGATMPDADELPEDLAPLAERNAVRISDTGWKDEVAHLVRALEKVVKDPKPTERAAPAPSPPPPHTAAPTPQPAPHPPYGYRQGGVAWPGAGGQGAGGWQPSPLPGPQPVESGGAPQ